MESPVKLLQQVRRRVQSVTYGSPIYRVMLDQGPMPDRVRLGIVDPWPGDAKEGQMLIASQPFLFDTLPAAWPNRRAFLAHEWLRDLRAVGSDLARRKAISLIDAWIDEQETWDEETWEPSILGARLANWIAFYEFYSPAASKAFVTKHLRASARQLRHLIHTAPAQTSGVEGLAIIKGLVYGGLALVEGERAMGLAFDLLIRQLNAEVLPDGGLISRNPARLAAFLRGMIDLRSVLRWTQLDVPHELEFAITRMVPVLKFFRHGDGKLTAFQGGNEGSALLFEATLTLAETRGRVLKRLPQMGYERLTAGRSLLLVDVAGPPPRGFDQEAHAGLLSFEFSVGRERLIVNCGAGPESDPEWQLAMAATAAHSTLTLGDTNACELLPDGGVGHRPRKITAQRYEQEDMQFLELAHDGYLQRQKVMIQRLLGLSKDGEQLLGREVISGPPGRDYTVRWHLHPSVTALLAQGGGAVLLRTASGAGWRLRIENAGAVDLALEASVYCGEGTMRRTLQVRVSGRTRTDPTILEWTLTHETMRKGG